MRTVLLPLALLLVLPAPGRAGKTAAPERKQPAKKAAPAASVPVSSSATFALPLFAPTTAPITVGLVVERFERFDRDLNTLSAAFRQSVRSDDTGQAQSMEGTFAYRKKDRMRIEHRVPDPQTLVCDGSRVWVWRPANAQVIRSELQAWKRSQPLAQGLLDFGNYAELLKRYDVSLGTVSAPGGDGHRSLSLVLKPRASASEGSRAKDKEGDFTLILRLSTRDYFPFDSELRVGAVAARTVFSEVRFNPELPDALFHFSPPAGADVLDFPASPR